MTADFVAAVIGGFESTLDEVLDRLAEGALRREIEALQQHLASKRQQISEMHNPEQVQTR